MEDTSSPSSLSEQVWQIRNKDCWSKLRFLLLPAPVCLIPTLSSWTTSLMLKRSKWTWRPKRRRRPKRSLSLECWGRSASARGRQARRSRAALHQLLLLHLCFWRCLLPPLSWLLHQLHLLHLLSPALLCPQTLLSFRRQCPRWHLTQSEFNDDNITLGSDTEENQKFQQVAEKSPKLQIDSSKVQISGKGDFPWFYIS